MNLVSRLAAGALLAVAAFAQGVTLDPTHPAVGSWFGKAVQICADEATCPKVALFMTPTLSADGAFLGNDTLALGGPPFGPHTTAHGKWVRTSGTDIVADYVFFLPSPDPKAPNLSTVLRFRWQASVIDSDTMTGFVNIWIQAPPAADWEKLGTDEYPRLPAEATRILLPPNRFIKDPGTCREQGCPLVFKFRIGRVRQ